MDGSSELNTTTDADADVVVVGGGLLGMCVAMLASRQEEQQPARAVLLCRLSDAEVPHADTLRNQSWLQSGLRYFELNNIEQRLAFAKRMSNARRYLHEDLGFELPTGFGVFRMKDDADADSLVSKGAVLGVPVQRLAEADAARLIGDVFFESGAFYCATPEITFDEPALLDELRARVKAAGRTLELDEPVELIPAANVSGGLRVRIGNVTLRPATTVLAAGAGNVPLLASLGLSTDLEIQQTPLLVITDGTVIPNARVLVDRVRKFSVVTHPPRPGMPDGAMVIGVDGLTEEDIPFVSPPDRRIARTASDKLWAPLPASLRHTHAARSRVTAGSS